VPLDIARLEQVGERLQKVEDERRQVMHQLAEEAAKQHDENAKHLYGKLSEVGQRATDLIAEQREICEAEIRRLHQPGQPGHHSADQPEIGRAT
jgi:ABC-type transporter Mla subunit MlaD